MNEDKVKRFVRGCIDNFDCRQCQALGVIADVNICCGDCEDVILKFLEVEG